MYAGALAAFAVLAWVRLSMATNQGTRIPDTNVEWTSHRQGNIAIHAAIGFAFAVLILAPYLAERMERRLAIGWTTALALPLLYLGAGTQNRGGLVGAFWSSSVCLWLPADSARPWQPSPSRSWLFAFLYTSDVSFDRGHRARPLSVRTIIDNIVSVKEGDDTGTNLLLEPGDRRRPHPG